MALNLLYKKVMKNGMAKSGVALSKNIPQMRPNLPFPCEKMQKRYLDIGGHFGEIEKILGFLHIFAILKKRTAKTGKFWGLRTAI